MAKTIDEQMELIRNISTQLENGGLSFEAALKKYEEGIKLIRSCESQIEKIEKRIEVIEKGEQE